MSQQQQPQPQQQQQQPQQQKEDAKPKQRKPRTLIGNWYEEREMEDSEEHLAKDPLKTRVFYATEEEKAAMVKDAKTVLQESYQPNQAAKQMSAQQKAALSRKGMKPREARLLAKAMQQAEEEFQQQQAQQQKEAQKEVDQARFAHVEARRLKSSNKDLKFKPVDEESAKAAAKMGKVPITFYSYQALNNQAHVGGFTPGSKSASGPFGKSLAFSHPLN
eukprot:TRINITY_DN65723_c9_g7_i1.p1 TRINITY_DN65723_c9_g7~~TRINITY_DN65723_c9_g7_i1.p1  ORF type:complete len:240 (-),score=142.27 TRINITY_DN65723_c9_g7_i1:139-795(-)